MASAGAFALTFKFNITSLTLLPTTSKSRDTQRKLEPLLQAHSPTRADELRALVAATNAHIDAVVRPFGASSSMTSASASSSTTEKWRSKAYLRRNQRAQSGGDATTSTSTSTTSSV